MPHKVFSRALDPKTEQDLFQEAFSWRKSPRRDRVAFEVFAADDPRQIVIGLFDDLDLFAVYVFYQISSDTWDCHFTSRRDAPKHLVWAAARQLVMFFTQNNLTLYAAVPWRNKPLRRWVESVGFTEKRKFADSVTVPSTTKLFVEYEARVNEDRVKRQEN